MPISPRVKAAGALIVAFAVGQAAYFSSQGQGYDKFQSNVIDWTLAKNHSK
jgi:hypothetical protein